MALKAKSREFAHPRALPWREGRTLLTVSNLTICVLVIGILLQHEAEVLTCFGIHAEHHLRHCEVVSNIRVCRIFYTELLKSNEGSFEITFKALDQTQLPLRFEVVRFNLQDL